MIAASRGSNPVGATLILKSFPGVSITRVIDRANARVPEHAHDWPVVSLFVVGAYSNCTELGESYISGPSAIFYRAGAAHRNDVSSTGFEQIEIEFDPAWLGRERLPPVPVRRWIGGRVAADARYLMQLCTGELSETRLLAEMRRFMAGAARASDRSPAGWTRLIEQRLRKRTPVSVADLAKELGRHPSWLGTAYKQAMGEGVLHTAARLRVEQAAHLLRETGLSYAQIASEAGFCDQSHMCRTLRRVLGRVPSAIRRDSRDFRQKTG